MSSISHALPAYRCGRYRYTGYQRTKVDAARKAHGGAAFRAPARSRTHTRHRRTATRAHALAHAHRCAHTARTRFLTHRTRSFHTTAHCARTSAGHRAVAHTARCTFAHTRHHRTLSFTLYMVTPCLPRLFARTLLPCCTAAAPRHTPAGSEQTRSFATAPRTYLPSVNIHRHLFWHHTAAWAW